MAAAAQALLLGDSQSESTASNLIFDVDETRAQHDSLPVRTIIHLSSDEQRLVVHNNFEFCVNKGSSFEIFLFRMDEIIITNFDYYDNCIRAKRLRGF